MNALESLNLLAAQPYLQMFLNIGSIVVMLYALKKFLGTPHDDLLSKVVTLERRMDDAEKSLNVNWTDHRTQKETNEAIQNSVLAIVDFELTFCSHAGYDIDTTDLEEAKRILRKHLSKK